MKHYLYEAILIGKKLRDSTMLACIYLCRKYGSKGKKASRWLLFASDEWFGPREAARSSISRLLASRMVKQNTNSCRLQTVNSGRTFYT